MHTVDKTGKVSNLTPMFDFIFGYSATFYILIPRNHSISKFSIYVDLKIWIPNIKYICSRWKAEMTQILKNIPNTICWNTLQI